MNRKTMRGLGNAFKTAVLLGALSALILLVGRILGGATGLLVAGLMALGMDGVAYFYSDKLALRAMRAQPVTVHQAPRLRGVLGHEISHVGNRDILIASVAAGLASMIMILADLAQLGALFGFGTSDEASGLGFLEILLIALLGPLAAGLIQAAISRSREYAADASGPEITGDPIALASALAKIERAAQARPLPATGRTGPVSALMIVSPFSGRTAMRMFSTHPDTRDRIARLRAMVPGHRM